MHAAGYADFIESKVEFRATDQSKLKGNGVPPVAKLVSVITPMAVDIGQFLLANLSSDLELASFKSLLDQCSESLTCATTCLNFYSKKIA